jgi:hypothetical protein
MTANFDIPPSGEQPAVAVELQRAPVDLFDLAPIGKHLHSSGSRWRT